MRFDAAKRDTLFPAEFRPEAGGAARRRRRLRGGGGGGPSTRAIGTSRLPWSFVLGQALPKAFPWPGFPSAPGPLANGGMQRRSRKGHVHK